MVQVLATDVEAHREGTYAPLFHEVQAPQLSNPFTQQLYLNGSRACLTCVDITAHAVVYGADHHPTLCAGLSVDMH
jgi:hypothetical protein